MDPIKQIELFPLQIPRDTPYLGPLEEGVTVSERGYFVRPGNQTIYSVHDHSLLIKLTTASGAVGWGESFGVLTPRTAATKSSLLADSNSTRHSSLLEKW